MPQHTDFLSHFDPKGKLFSQLEGGFPPGEGWLLSLPTHMFSVDPLFPLAFPLGATY